MPKVDLTKKFKTYYSGNVQPKLVELQPSRYISITGTGDPSGEDFASRIQALYSVAYAVKFQSKQKGHDFVVPKLEGLWWYDEKKYSNIVPDEAPQRIPREEWRYRLLVQMPGFVAADVLPGVQEEIKLKKDVPHVEDVMWHSLNEGRCVQVLHVGPFSEEVNTLKRVRTFMEDYQLTQRGLHHEIYLSDFRKTLPEKLKTILRAPVR